jgi:methylaspartate mutase sigma subunit
VNKTAILTTIPSDAHSWNLVFMQMFLEERGCRVINLGTCVPFQQVIDSCVQENPALVVVSTTNGHGYMEGADLARLLGRLDNRSRMKLVVGGKLGVDQAQDSEYAEILSNAGFDAVFHGATALDDFVALMANEFPEEVLESATRR